jgi:hypothetical protein
MFASCLFSKSCHLDSISCPLAMSIHSLRSLPSGKTEMNKQSASAVMVSCSSPAFMTTMARTSMHHQLKLPAITSPKFTKCPSAGLSNRAFRTLEPAPYRSYHAISDRDVRQYADESGSCPTGPASQELAVECAISLCAWRCFVLAAHEALSKMAPGSLGSRYARRRVWEQNREQAPEVESTNRENGRLQRPETLQDLGNLPSRALL